MSFEPNYLAQLIIIVGWTPLQWSYMVLIPTYKWMELRLLTATSEMGSLSSLCLCYTQIFTQWNMSMQ